MEFFRNKFLLDCASKVLELIFIWSLPFLNFNLEFLHSLFFNRVYTLRKMLFEIWLVFLNFLFILWFQIWDLLFMLIFDCNLAFRESSHSLFLSVNFKNHSLHLLWKTRVFVFSISQAFSKSLNFSHSHFLWSFHLGFTEKVYFILLRSELFYCSLLFFQQLSLEFDLSIQAKNFISQSSFIFDPFFAQTLMCVFEIPYSFSQEFNFFLLYFCLLLCLTYRFSFWFQDFLILQSTFFQFPLQLIFFVSFFKHTMLYCVDFIHQLFKLRVVCLF